MRQAIVILLVSILAVPVSARPRAPSGLQTERQGSIVTEQLSFDRVKAVKQLHRESAGRSIGRTMLITGIVVGTVFGVIFLIALIATGVD